MPIQLNEFHQVENYFTQNFLHRRLQLLPKKWRDAGYNWIAHRRHALGPQLCLRQPSKIVSRQLP